MSLRFAAVLIALLACAAPARAATVSVEHHIPPANPKFPEPAYDTVAYRAAAGETNTLTASDGPPGQVVFRDATAPLAAGPGCTAAADGSVACPVDRGAFPPTGVEVRAGDGDDQVLAATAAVVYGEAGADRLESTASATLDGGDGDDTLTGGPAADMLRGGDGADKLGGGAGDDSLDGGYGGDDVLDGGDGRDRLLMSRDHDVVVDLTAGTAGGPGERDAIASLERVLTGEGDDRIVGSEGADEIDAGAGDDAVDGRGGDDRLDGGSGANVLDGGAGDDHLRWGARSCGTGTDVLETAGTPSAPGDCESIGFDHFFSDVGTVVTRAPVRFNRRGVRFAVACPVAPEGSACTVRLTVKTRHGRVIARAARTLTVARGASAVATLRLTRQGRRVLRSRRVSVSVSSDGEGWLATYSTRVSTSRR
jgi:hypothetical protein